MISSIEKVRAALATDAPLDVLRVGISACQGIMTSLLARALPLASTVAPTPAPASAPDSATETATKTKTETETETPPTGTAATSATVASASTTTAPTPTPPTQPSPAPAPAPAPHSIGDLPALVAIKAASRQQLLEHVIAKLRGAQPAENPAASLRSLSLDQVLDLGLAKLHSALAPPAPTPPAAPPMPRVEVMPPNSIPSGARVVHLTPARPHR